MKANRLVAVALTLFAVAGLSAGTALAGEVRVNGSTTVLKLAIAPNKDTIEKLTGVPLVLVGNGSSRGLKDIATGNADIAMLSAPLPTVAAIVRKDVPTLDVADLRVFPVGQADAYLAVNKANPVKAVTPEQAQGLLSGKIANWKEVGGPDLPVVVVTEMPGGGTRTVVEGLLMEGTPLAAGHREVPNAPSVATVVGQLPAAIGIISTENLLPTTLALEVPGRKFPMALTLVTKGEPAGDVKKIVDAVAAAVGHK